MERIVTREQMRRLETEIMEEVGLESPILMERAAIAAFHEMEKSDLSGGVIVFCGPGNNGGDGLALFRILKEKKITAFVYLLGDQTKYSAENKKQQQILEKLFGSDVIKRELPKDLPAASVCVDALFGIGQSRGLAGEFLQAVDLMNASKGLKVSLDLPTGIHTDTGLALLAEDGRKAFVKADLTVTFGCGKTGLFLADGKVASGKVVAADCGIVYPDRFDAIADGGAGYLLQKEDLCEVLKRDPLGNKGSFGKLALWAGGKKAAGAALLCVHSAFAAGAGYIKLLSYEENRQLVLSAVPETVYLSLEQTDRQQSLEQAISFADVIGMGCAVGANEDASGILKDLIEKLSASARKPALVLDADVLTILSKEKALWEALEKTGCTRIMTPHMAEFARLSALSIQEIAADRLQAALSFAEKHQTILVLKDATTLVAAPDGRFSICPFGNDGMAVAGSGDCLMGIIAAVLGTKKDPFLAASSGVYLHAMAGDLAAAKKGNVSMMPSDLTECVTSALAQILA